MKYWILVCDASRAKLYGADRLDDHQWKMLAEHEHPESRKKSSELSPTEPGSALRSKGQSQRARLDPHTEPHEVEAERFAESLCQELKKATRERSFERLILVAPPQFLGQLRQRLDAETAKRVHRSVDRDLTQVPEREMIERIAALEVETA